MNETITRNAPVLLVDDDAGILEELAITLRKSGIACLTASTGRDALRLLRENASIQVLVTDLRMPQMDGFTLIQAMKDLMPAKCRPRIIFISGHATSDSILEALRHNPVDLLRKPFRAAEFVQRVESGMALAAQDRERDAVISSVESGMGQVTSELAALSERIASIQERSGTTDDEPGSGDRHLARNVATLLQIRNQRNRAFPPGLFSDPAWDMLLDLTENHLLGRSTYVSGLAVGADVPLTTALRHLELLAEHDLILRLPDPLDRRRMLIKITPEAVSLMSRALFLPDSAASGPS